MIPWPTLDPSSGNCTVCGLSWDAHEHVLGEVHPEYVSALECIRLLKESLVGNVPRQASAVPPSYLHFQVTESSSVDTWTSTTTLGGASSGTVTSSWSMSGGILDNRTPPAVQT